MKNYLIDGGSDLPSEKETIAAFTENGVGMVVGYALYNKLRLTTQVSKNIQIYTSALDEQKKQIGNVFLQKHDMIFSPEVVRTVSVLEVLQNYNKIEDLNVAQFHKLCADFAKSKYSNLRIDTHEKNTPMQTVIKRNGFVYAGIIICANGTPRLAYDWIQTKKE